MNTRALQDKNAVVLGAGGSIGAAVAKEFAAEGARVFLAGRTKASLEAVAKQIVASGGEARTAVIDTLDDASVNRYVDSVAKQAGNIDIVLDASGPLAKDYGNGKIAVDMPIDEFMVPLATMVRSRFITARAAARSMIKQHSGVIILVTGSPARAHVQGATAIGAAFGAIENLTENLAFEVSPLGVRVVCVRTLANIDSRSIQDTMNFLAGQLNITKDQAVAPCHGLGRRGRGRARRGRRDLARQPLLADAELVDAARYPLLTSGDTGSDPIYAPRNLLLIGDHIVGDLVDALPHRVEIERRYVGPLLIGRRGGWGDHVGSVVRNRFGLRRQPAKLWVRVCDHLSRCVAVRLPSQGGSDTDAKSYQ